MGIDMKALSVPGIFAARESVSTGPGGPRLRDFFRGRPLRRVSLTFGIVLAAFFLGCSSSDGTSGVADVTSADGLERVTQTLVSPPFLPAHQQVATGGPRVVQVRLVIEEKLIEIAPDGAKIWAMTFNGSVPGPIIVVHQNDYVELTLVNPDTNSLPHNIDLHAATGELAAPGSPS